MRQIHDRLHQLRILLNSNANTIGIGKLKIIVVKLTESVLRINEEN